MGYKEEHYRIINPDFICRTLTCLTHSLRRFIKVSLWSGRGKRIFSTSKMSFKEFICSFTVGEFWKQATPCQGFIPRRFSKYQIDIHLLTGLVNLKFHLRIFLMCNKEVRLKCGFTGLALCHWAHGTQPGVVPSFNYSPSHHLKEKTKTNHEIERHYHTGLHFCIKKLHNHFSL